MTTVGLDSASPPRDDVVVRVPVFESHEHAGAVRDLLVGRHFASATEIVVLQGGRPVGLVPIEAAFSAAAAVPIGELAQIPPTVLRHGGDEERALREAVDAGNRSVVVVDEDGRFEGLLPPTQLLTMLAREHDEDLARLGGFLATTSAARTATEERVGRRLWHRLPWLGLGLAGAMASAGIVASFEEELRAEVLLAFFIPAVVYMADAVGTQTEAIVIRGLAVGASLTSILRREALTGFLIGALLGAAFLPFAVLAWGDGRVALSVSLALFASCSIATVVAMVLPYGLARLGRDPAFGSGPLATVIQDLLSILVYFGVAAALLP